MRGFSMRGFSMRQKPLMEKPCSDFNSCKYCSRKTLGTEFYFDFPLRFPLQMNQWESAFSQCQIPKYFPTRAWSWIYWIYPQIQLDCTLNFVSIVALGRQLPGICFLSGDYGGKPFKRSPLGFWPKDWRFEE